MCTHAGTGIEPLGFDPLQLKPPTSDIDDWDDDDGCGGDDHATDCVNGGDYHALSCYRLCTVASTRRRV